MRCWRLTGQSEQLAPDDISQLEGLAHALDGDGARWAPDLERPVDVETDELRHIESPQLGCLPNITQPPLGGVVNAASAVSARTVT